MAEVLEWMVWAVVAVSVGYVAVFAFASRLPSGRRAGRGASSSGNASGHTEALPRDALPRFLIIIPAYKEDSVILPTAEAALRQDYPEDLRSVCIVSDHQQPSTNDALRAMPLMLLQPDFPDSSKAKALQAAVSEAGGEFSHVVVLDADNIVEEDFLSRLSLLLTERNDVIQCHRTAKNSDGSVALLDGVSEEINNSVFRLGHNRLRLPSALIGSGMCFPYEWFASNVPLLSTAGEDRELEKLLLSQRVFIRYAEDILVRDEKVSTAGNFQRQRQRWMSAQAGSLLSLLKDIWPQIKSFNVAYLDKTLQQALIPRSMLLLLLVCMLALSLVLPLLHPLRWACLLALLLISLLAAVPRRMLSLRLLRSALSVPLLALRMFRNLLHIDVANKTFIHTSHTSR